MRDQRQFSTTPRSQPSARTEAPVLVVGAGVGGLAAAVVLASQGLAVQVLERDTGIGGKLKPVPLGGLSLDIGPTVMTLKGVFDGLFDLAGERLDQHLKLTPLQTLARHTWPDGSSLDLHADQARSVDAIGRFAGAGAASAYADFCDRTRRVYEALEGAYLQSARPNPLSLTWRCGLRGLPGLLQGAPMRSLWRVLGRQFADARLRQLFARYATYGGSSPFQAPGTLMLIAHVEQAGVWSVDGGMHALARALAALARRLGVEFHTGCGVAQVALHGGPGGRVCGVVLDDGRALPASAVVFNGDAAALSAGLLGPAVQQAVGGSAAPRADRKAMAQGVGKRSLSALTWNLVTPVPADAPLLRHNVFFSSDYAAEFEQLFGQGRLPHEPTVYVCAHDRLDRPVAPQGAAGAPERLMCLVNAPARADWQPLNDEEIAACEARTFRHLARLGLALHPTRAATLRLGPAQWAQRFPATGGALYGQATHGWMSSFTRPSAATPVAGLYLTGGSTHPGAGVPMAALSGWRAAELCLAQRPGRISTGSSRPAAMPGGTSMR